MNRAHLMSEMLLWHTARKEDEGKMLIEDFFYGLFNWILLSIHLLESKRGEMESH